MKNEDNFLNYKRASEFLGLPIGTLYSLVSKKQIPHVRIGGRSVLFDVRDLNQWVDSKKVTTNKRKGGSK